MFPVRVEWLDVQGSSVIVAEAYDPAAGKIYVRFSSGDEWWYGPCSREEWEAFRQGSRGTYLNAVLKNKPSGRVT